MMCRNTLAASIAAVGLMSGLGFAQENTRPGQNPLEPPRAADNTDPKRTPNSGAAVGENNNTGGAANRAGDRMGAAGSDAASAIRSLANDPMASDKLFALMAAQGNQWEVAFNNLVAERATTKEIKDHAAMIAKDHQMAQQKLEPIAQKHNVMLPQGLPPEKQAKLEVFRSMPVDKLETCWLTEMRAGHAKDIVSYADHVKTLQNEELRAYTSETLPKLRQHGAEVNRIAATKGLTNDAMTPAAGGASHGAGHAAPAPTMNH